MEKKALLWIGVGIFVLWLIKATGFIAAAVLFLLAGVIPGTSISIPPIPMLILLGIALLLTAYWIRKQRLATQIKQLKAKHAASIRKPANTSKTTRKKSAPKSSSKKKLPTKATARHPRRRFTSAEA